MRVTLHEESDATILRIEGRIVGPWVQELDRAWRLAAASLGSKTFLVDLCGVMHMDAAGRQVLADIHQRTGAEFLANSPMTKYFAEEARRNKRDDAEEEG
ncbi:MAG: hypothetical protein WCA15_13025 [Candidatus Acidiferrales bacterium]